MGCEPETFSSKSGLGGVDANFHRYYRVEERIHIGGSRASEPSPFVSRPT